jgi:hypothetical protein
MALERETFKDKVNIDMARNAALSRIEAFQRAIEEHGVKTIPAIKEFCVAQEPRWRQVRKEATTASLFQPSDEKLRLARVHGLWSLFKKTGEDDEELMVDLESGRLVVSKEDVYEAENPRKTLMMAPNTQVLKLVGFLGKIEAVLIIARLQHQIEESRRQIA